MSDDFITVEIKLPKVTKEERAEKLSNIDLKIILELSNLKDYQFKDNELKLFQKALWNLVYLSEEKQSIPKELIGIFCMSELNINFSSLKEIINNHIIFLKEKFKTTKYNSEGNFLLLNILNMFNDIFNQVLEEQHNG